MQFEGRTRTATDLLIERAQSLAEQVEGRAKAAGEFLTDRADTAADEYAKAAFAPASDILIERTHGLAEQVEGRARAAGEFLERARGCRRTSHRKSYQGDHRSRFIRESREPYQSGHILADRTQAIAEQVEGRTKTAADVLAERTHALSHQVESRAKAAGDLLLEWAENAASQVEGRTRTASEALGRTQRKDRPADGSADLRRGRSPDLAVRCRYKPGSKPAPSRQPMR